MNYIIHELQEDPIRIFFILIIFACIIGIIRAIKEVCGWWKAWSIEVQKRKPPVRYPVHFDKKT